MTNIGTYLLLINILGFILYLIYYLLRPGIFKNFFKVLLHLIGIGGGAFGLVLAILIFDRNSAKEGLDLKVFAFIYLLIESIIYLFLKKDIESLNLDFIRFFKNHLGLLAYLGLINLITFLGFLYDKYRAKNDGRRLKNAFLLGLSFVGGSLGGLLGMKVLRHKTKKIYYKLTLPLMILMHFLLIVYFMN